MRLPLMVCPTLIFCCRIEQLPLSIPPAHTWTLNAPAASLVSSSWTEMAPSAEVKSWESPVQPVWVCLVVPENVWVTGVGVLVGAGDEYPPPQAATPVVNAAHRRFRA